MLSRDVAHALANKQFHVYTVGTTGEGIEVLTGVPARQRSDLGKFPEGSLNWKVEKRLLKFADGYGPPREIAATKRYLE